MILTGNELRIGNLVYYKNTKDFARVEIIHNKHFDCRDEYGSFTPNGNYEPIPLTEEILLKCCKSYEFFHDGVIIYKFGVFNAYKQNRIWLADSLSGFGKEYKHITHLHKLQNLYFVLTGEELEVEL